MGRQEDLDAAYAELERRKNPAPPRLVDLLDDPVKFAERMGFELQPWQKEIMRRELVTWEEIKALMDRKLHVGQVTSLAGDGSKTPAVFSKRECARDIAEMVNRKFREVKR